MFVIGLHRDIDDGDICAVKSDMQSDSNTEAFAELWELECKKKTPNLFRIMLKMYLYQLLPAGMLLAVAETIARYYLNIN